MNEFLIGYARVSTNEQDLTAQRNALEALAACRIGGSVHDPTDPVGRLLFNVARSTIYRTVQRQSGPKGD